MEEEDEADEGDPASQERISGADQPGSAPEDHHANGHAAKGGKELASLWPCRMAARVEECASIHARPQEQVGKRAARGGWIDRPPRLVPGEPLEAGKDGGGPAPHQDPGGG